MITIEQCRAARGLLNWTQQDLADASDLSKTAINNFEKGNSSIKMDSIQAVRQAFEQSDIEFLPNAGLRKKSDSSEILKGENALDDLATDIAETLQQTGGELLIYNIDENSTIQSKLTELLERLDLPEGKENIHMRILCTQSLQKTPQPATTAMATATCRWAKDAKSNHNTPFYIYGSKVAIQLWEQSMVVIVNSKDANTSERVRFEHIWEAASPAVKTAKAASA